MLLTKLDTMRYGFSKRLRADAMMLETCRAAIKSDPRSSMVLDRLQSRAHKLAGAAGVFGFQAVSSAASKLEDSIIGQRRGGGTSDELEADLHTLLVCIATASGPRAMPRIG
jgi:HPt (histidine-containing phosphotransfer) domain-containing protein